MPDVVRVSRLQITATTGVLVRVSRIGVTTSAVTPVGNRLRVSRVSVASQFAPTNATRIRVSRISGNATVKGPGTFAWIGGKIQQARAYMWLSGQIVPITTRSSVVLPPNPPAPTDVYTDVYSDLY